MLNQPTLEKLHDLRLSVMAGSWQDQVKDPKIGGLTFDERFALLVDAEHMARDNRRLSRLLKNAEMRFPHACIEDVDTSRGVDKAMLMQLAGCGWIGEHLNALITGATGTGKSYLACALGQMACRRNLTVTYRRVPRLFEELGLARVDGTYARVLAKLAKADVLILDDLGVGKPLRSPRDTTCWKCSRTDTASSRPWSQARWITLDGTSGSPTPRWPTQFWTASCTTHTSSNSRDLPDARSPLPTADQH